MNNNLKYLVLPYWAYQDNRLNATQVKVYSFINSFRGEEFYFSNKHLAEMFNVSERSISSAISKLEELEYIEVNSDIKAGGGTIRYIQNQAVPGKVEEVFQSDTKRSSSRTRRGLLPNDNKINGNKINDKEKENKKKKSLSQLDDTDFTSIAESYNVPISFVRSKYEDLQNYCKANGKRYKDYKAALRNFVKKDALQIRQEAQREQRNRSKISQVAI